MISVAVFCLDLELYLCFLGFLETVNLDRLTTPRGSILALDCGEVVAKSCNLPREIPAQASLRNPPSCFLNFSQDHIHCQSFLSKGIEHPTVAKG